MKALKALSYAEDIQPYCYVGFEPPWHCNASKYKIKLGYHHMRMNDEDYDMMRYIRKKPLNWFMEGAGIVWFPIPQRYNTYPLRGRAAEEDLKVMF